MEQQADNAESQPHTGPGVSAWKSKSRPSISLQASRWPKGAEVELEGGGQKQDRVLRPSWQWRLGERFAFSRVKEVRKAGVGTGEDTQWIKCWILNLEGLSLFSSTADA